MLCVHDTCTSIQACIIVHFSHAHYSTCDTFWRDARRGLELCTTYMYNYAVMLCIDGNHPFTRWKQNTHTCYVHVLWHADEQRLYDIHVQLCSYVMYWWEPSIQNTHTCYVHVLWRADDQRLYDIHVQLWPVSHTICNVCDTFWMAERGGLELLAVFGTYRTSRRSCRYAHKSECMYVYVFRCM
jgi:hypothetical protein